MELDNNNPYFVLFNVKPEWFSEEKIDYSCYSTRIQNVFESIGVDTIGKLLSLSRSDLFKIPKLGTTSVIQIDKVLHSFFDPINSYLKGKSSKIAIGDFSFSDEKNLPKEARIIIDGYKRAYRIIGTEFAYDCIYLRDKVDPVFSILEDIDSEKCERLKQQAQLRSMLLKLPEDRLTKRAYDYILLFSRTEKQLNQLQSICLHEDCLLSELFCNCEVLNETVFGTSIAFLRWCQFNIQMDIAELIERTYRAAGGESGFINNRAIKVIKGRANGQTLEEIGYDFGLSRQRIQQIENQCIRGFSVGYSRCRILNKISAVKEGDILLTPQKLEEFFSERTEEVVYLLKKCENLYGYKYNQELNAFIFEKN